MYIHTGTGCPSARLARRSSRRLGEWRTIFAFFFFHFPHHFQLFFYHLLGLKLVCCRAELTPKPQNAAKTDSGEPYRLYNLDVFEYETSHPFGLYGSVPVLYGHSPRGTSAVLWLNSAETWVDVGTHPTAAGGSGSGSGGDSGSGSGGDSGSDSGGDGGSGGGGAGDGTVDGADAAVVASALPRRRIDTLFISESGLISLLVVPLGSPSQVFRTLSLLTGPAQLPPLFALGHHQCRWNYNDQADMLAVNAGFDTHDIPTDVLWLDIEHTDGKRYFTWDSGKFPDPARMMNEIHEASGRKVVTIVDPHIKRDPGYSVHSEATSLGHYVKKPDGVTDFEGHCWPGASSYVDFTSPEARDWWRGKFRTYPGKTEHLYTWVDMQEPSVFGSPLGAPEVTMPKDLRHKPMGAVTARRGHAGLVEIPAAELGGTEHRDVHNVYGMYTQRAAYEGNLALRSEEDRPFVLARAFFAGSQRYGAVWTGDNTAEWSHLRASIPMLLTLGLAGITFSGADVGGFFGNPSTELLVRWYQAAAYQPFFRSHAHIDTARREPWLFGEQVTGLVREAISARYALMPYLYTAFHEASSHVAPVMRPLWFEFPMDEATFETDDAFMLGRCLLVHPVTREGAETAEVYLPTHPRPFREVWYDAETLDVFEPGSHVVQAPLRKTPVFVRGGCIVPRRERRRRSTAQMAADPYTLKIALNPHGIARGTVYLDDGKTHAFKSGEYSLMSLKMTGKGVIKSQRISGSAPARGGTGTSIERIVVVGWGDRPVPASVTYSVAGRAPLPVSFEAGATDGTLILRKPGVAIDEEWEIVIS
jgi:alpha 1,3-glucosidase